jgi:tRNA(fMet)-specific endonuclease VapC
VNYLRQPAGTVATKLAAASPGSVTLCSVVVAELLYGVERSVQKIKNLADVQAFRAKFISLPFDDIAAQEYGRLRARLEKLGTPIGPNDLMIAAIALANNLIVVTHNTAEFSRVPNLSIEDWQVP